MRFQPAARAFLRCSILTIVVLGLTQSSDAEVDFYYDPATGNVSFDTANTSTGYAVGIGLELHPFGTDIRFSTEEMIRLSNSGLYDATPTVYAEITWGTPWEGTYTLGNILPTGLEEQEWLTLFDAPSGGSKTLERIGGGGDFPTGDFHYGRPDGEYNNRSDLIDLNNVDWAEEATLFYLPGSGELFLDLSGPNGGYISGLALISTRLNYENFISPVPGSGIQADSSGVGFNLGEVLAPGIYNLGELLPKNLTEQVFPEHFDSAFFATGTGKSSSDLDFQTSGTPIRMAILNRSIPEPSGTIALFSSAVLAGLRRQRVN